MKLRAFLQSTTNAWLAKAIGVPPPLVSQWKTGVRPVPAARCVQIERATRGAVRRWDLRPDDWHEFWPELIGTTGAPKVRRTRKAA